MNKETWPEEMRRLQTQEIPRWRVGVPTVSSSQILITCHYEWQVSLKGDIEKNPLRTTALYRRVLNRYILQMSSL